jgi:hypothetical protein
VGSVAMEVCARCGMGADEGVFTCVHNPTRNEEGEEEEFVLSCSECLIAGDLVCDGVECR